MSDETEVFIWAIKNGDLEKVKELIDAEKFTVNTEMKSRYPIHYAADFGQKEVLKYLISKGVNIDVTDKYGITALLSAIWEDHKDCVQLLIDSGAAVNNSAPDGKSYIDSTENPEIKAILRNK